jgi:two-component system sensor histidine kinase YesM
MMNRWLLSSLRNGSVPIRNKLFVKLIMLILIPNVFFLLFIQILSSQQVENKTKEINNILQILQNATHREVQFLMDNVRSITNQIIIDPQIQQILTKKVVKQTEGDSYLTQERLRVILSRYRLGWNHVFSIVIITPDKQAYLTSFDRYTIKPADLEQSKLVQEVFDSSQTGIAWSSRDALTKDQKMITMARKIYSVDRPQDIIGYVLVNLSLDSIREAFETYNYYEDMIFGMMNGSGNQTLLYQDGQIIGDNKSIFGKSTRIEEGITNLSWGGNKWRTSTKRSEEDLYLFVGLDEDYIAEQITQFRNSLYYAFALFLMVSILLSIRGAQIITRRLNILVQAMRRFGQEQWGTRVEPKGNDEIRMLGDKFNVMASQIEQLLIDLNQEQRLKRLFELQVLEYQINPHFLYNTLDSIHLLSLENNETKISQMVNGLSRLFRLILSKGKEMIPIEQELEMVRIYLNIQKIRFTDRFEFQFFLEPGVASYPVAKLILQPIVENAIMHGIRKLRVPGVITIIGRLEDDDVVLEVADNGVGMREEHIDTLKALLLTDVLAEDVITSSGYGLKNVDSRLKLTYGGHYRMSIHSSVEGNSGTIIQIRIKELIMRKKRDEMIRAE